MIKRVFIGLVIATLFCLPGYAIAGVKVYLDETKSEYVIADKLDCNVYEGKAGITIGFKVGNMLLSVGPEITLGNKNRIKWDKTVHAIIARYKELCTRLNSGAITMKEYNARIEQIDKIAKEMREFQEKMMSRVKAEAKDAFKELDRETKGGDFMSSEKIDENIEDIGLKIENLSY